MLTPTYKLAAYSRKVYFLDFLISFSCFLIAAAYEKMFSVYFLIGKRDEKVQKIYFETGAACLLTVREDFFAAARNRQHHFNDKRSRIMLNKEALLTQITVNPRIMTGKPTIRSLRITVEQLLRGLSGGVTEQELLDDYPELEKEDFLAVFAYVTELVAEEQVFPVAVSV